MSNGPGAYNTNNVKNLKKNPNATFGKAKRKSMLCNAPLVPGLEKYNGHRVFNKERSLSKENNAPKFTIGNEGKSNI